MATDFLDRFDLMHVLARLWRGDYGLGRTYWLFGWCVGAAYLVIDVALEATSARLPSSAWSVLRLGLGIAYLAYHIVWTVGVWRAARAYKGPKWLAVLAYVMTVLSWAAVGFPHMSETSLPRVPPAVTFRW